MPLVPGERGFCRKRDPPGASDSGSGADLRHPGIPGSKPGRRRFQGQHLPGHHPKEDARADPSDEPGGLHPALRARGRRGVHQQQGRTVSQRQPGPARHAGIREQGGVPENRHHRRPLPAGFGSAKIPGDDRAGWTRDRLRGRATFGKTPRGWFWGTKGLLRIRATENRWRGSFGKPTIS